MFFFFDLGDLERDLDLRLEDLDRDLNLKDSRHREGDLGGVRGDEPLRRDLRLGTLLLSPVVPGTDRESRYWGLAGGSGGASSRTCPNIFLCRSGDIPKGVTAPGAPEPRRDPWVGWRGEALEDPLRESPLWRASEPLRESLREPREP